MISTAQDVLIHSSVYHPSRPSQGKYHCTLNYIHHEYTNQALINFDTCPKNLLDYYRDCSCSELNGKWFSHTDQRGCLLRQSSGVAGEENIYFHHPSHDPICGVYAVLTDKDVMCTEQPMTSSENHKEERDSFGRVFNLGLIAVIMYKMLAYFW